MDNVIRSVPAKAIQLCSFGPEARGADLWGECPVAEVYRDGTPTSAMDPLELRTRAGMVFQLPALSGVSVEALLREAPFPVPALTAHQGAEG